MEVCVLFGVRFYQFLLDSDVTKPSEERAALATEEKQESRQCIEEVKTASTAT